MSRIIGGCVSTLLTPEEAAAMDAPGTKDAAVLVALHGDPLTAVFTERRADLRRHAGEISFPGGAQDGPTRTCASPRCARPRRRSACRAAPSRPRARLPPVGTFVTGYRVFPFVGTIERPAPLRPQEAEVAQILEFSLARPRCRPRDERLVRKGVPIKTPTYTVDGHLVWARRRGSSNRCSRVRAAEEGPSLAAHHRGSGGVAHLHVLLDRHVTRLPHSVHEPS